MQLASYLERGPLMWMMHLHVNQKSDYDYDDDLGGCGLKNIQCWKVNFVNAVCT